MITRELLGQQRPLEYQDAAREILAYEARTARSVCNAVQLAVAYGVILGKRMERAKRKARQKGGAQWTN